MFARRRDDPDDPDGYSVPHTAITYLVSPEGEYAHHFAGALAAAGITAGTRAFVAGGSSSGNPAGSSGPRRVIPEAYR